MSQRIYAELKFTLLAIKSEGQAYEDLFNQVMKKRYPSFKKVQAYGNIGDRKNDGFNPSSGHYYQVFAPANVDKQRTVVDAVAKLEVDFNGLVTNWNDIVPISSFSFVVNDKQKGCPAPVEQKIGIMNRDIVGKDFSTFTMDDLIEEFLQLDVPNQESIIGYIPRPDRLTTLSIPALTETIQHLCETTEVPPRDEEDLRQEEFEAKIEFNNLDDSIKELMERAEMQTYVLDEYFNRNQDKTLKNFIRDILKHTYQNEKALYHENTAVNASIIFYKILDKCAIEPTKDAINSGIALIAYFFISCDIYEKPNIE